MVEGITVDKLTDLIDKKVNVLIIDTEWYDVEIIKFYFDNEILPDIIYFERPGICGYLLDNSEVLIGQNAIEYLNNNLEKFNYSIKKLQDNWLCIKNDLKIIE